jgi:glycerophosphodiester phosphodiesterase
LLENTLLSFVTASSLGAEYVEFDVQLTRDNVPIIYHNWIIPDPQSSSGIEVPIGEITLKQLKGRKSFKKK